MNKSSNIQECPHDVVERYLCRANAAPPFAGILLCGPCVPDSEFARYSGWKRRKELRHQRATIAKNNFHHKDTETQREGGANAQNKIPGL
jgi:hypothetical protein